MNYYTIYDDVAEECGNLFPAKNDGIATRNVFNLFHADNVLPSIREHLHLYCMLEFNTETMEITPCKREVTFTNDGDETL